MVPYRQIPGFAKAVADPWYVAEAEHGQQLLLTGQIEHAAEIFRGLLGRLGDAPSYARAAVLGKVARCLYSSGKQEQAVARLREALDVAEQLAPTDGLTALRGTLRSELGEVFRALGQPDAARQEFVEALRIAEQLRDLRAQAVELSRLGALALTQGDREEALNRYRAALGLVLQLQEPAMQAAVWHQLGVVFHEQRQWREAERHYQEAARIREQQSLVAAAQQTWNQLALLNQELDRPVAAEAWLRKAIEASHRSADRSQLAAHLVRLAGVLRSQPARLDEAQHLAETALNIHKIHDPAAPQLWQAFGVLADILDAQATVIGADPHRSELQTQARNYRHLHEYAPRFLAALSRLRAEPSYARAVVLGRVARCFYISGHHDQAVARLREALGVIEVLAATEGLTALRGTLHSELGEVLRALGKLDEANQQLCEALRVAEQLKGEQPVAESAPSHAVPFQVTIDEEWITDYGLDADLLVDGPRLRKIARWADEPPTVAADARPTLVPCVRVHMDSEGAIRFCLPMAEPTFERHPGCIVIRRRRREIRTSGSSAILWRLIGAMDGNRDLSAVLSELPLDDRPVAARVLGMLAATGAVDISGRPIGRFVHSTTKKGVMPAGGLEGDQVLRWVMAEDREADSGRSRITLSPAVPERLRPFHALTRLRRSRRDFNAMPLCRTDLDALLHTACGVTGAMQWGGQELKLRAYPASGGLYAVRIYPVVLRVEGLAPGVYRYRPAENCLEVVRNDVDWTLFAEAMLPSEREMVVGAAVMFCLTGCFPRHERKYGEGGYRMLVAETGHISQNLILTAVALGLSARPFGGVFDDLLNRDLELGGDEEQFLLSVLVGHAGSASPPAP